MTNKWFPQDQVLWYTEAEKVKECTQDMDIDIAVIGGGMAGMTVAYQLHKRGISAALFEQSVCGGGASGKSSGFITPNAELSLTDFKKQFPQEIAHALWELFLGGLEHIRETIQVHNLSCGYTEQDTLVLAKSERALKGLEEEYKVLRSYKEGTHFYDKNEIGSLIGSDNYHGALKYTRSFGIDGYAYCQGIKKLLERESNVKIFEHTPVHALKNNTIITPCAKINAKQIIICTDRYLPQLDLLQEQVYHVQTFLMASGKLTEKQIRTLFPQKPHLCWDTELIYNYFRLTHDNRLLLGGGSLLSTYSTAPLHEYEPIVKKLTSYWKKQFPDNPIEFEYAWPGLIGISKDIFPLAGRDKVLKNRFYIAGAAGLHIAAALGLYAVKTMLDGTQDMLESYLSPYRKFLIQGKMQEMLGQKLSFALSHTIKKNIP